MASVIITPAQGLALDIVSVRQQCRIDDDAEDAYITGVLIPAVCALFESETRHRLLTTVMEDALPAWPRTGRIDLGWGAVQQVVSVSYLDQTGALQVLDPALYQVNADAQPGEVHRSPGASLPPCACAIAPASATRSMPCHPMPGSGCWLTWRTCGPTAKPARPSNSNRCSNCPG